MLSPKVSLCIFSYNQEEYIEDAIKGAMSQNYENMEIIVSDDNSTDGTRNVISNLKKKYQKLIVNFNDKNIGIAAHVEYVANYIATGDLIILNAGDDVSKSNRCKAISDVWVENNRPSLIMHDMEFIDYQGSKIVSEEFYRAPPHDINKMSSLEKMMDFFCGDTFLPIPGAVYAISKYVFENFKHASLYGLKAEDQSLYIRSCLCGDVIYLDKCLILRRIHNNNLTVLKNRKWKKKITIRGKDVLIKKAVMYDSYENNKIMNQHRRDFLYSVEVGLFKFNALLLKEIENRINYRENKLLSRMEGRKTDVGMDYQTALTVLLFAPKKSYKDAINNLPYYFEKGFIVCWDECVGDGMKKINQNEINEKNIDIVFIFEQNFFAYKEIIEKKFDLKNIHRLHRTVNVG